MTLGVDIYTKKHLKDLLDTINLITYDINEEQHYISATITQKPVEKLTSQNRNNKEINNEFLKNYNETKLYKRFLNKINRNYERAKQFDELELVETIAEYNIQLSELSFNKNYFFQCRDAIDNLYRLYYKNFVLKTLKNKSSDEILSTLENNIKGIYKHDYVRKTLVLIIYYDTLINYYTNELSEDEKAKIIFGLNTIITYFTNHYKRPVVTKYKCNVCLKVVDSYDLKNFELNFQFKNEEGFYKSPDNSTWINVSTKQVENMNILSSDGLYDNWIQKFKDNNIVHYSLL